jgi:O-acetyl-ADP-ribose deacetylase (regulator of RNase III)
LFLVEASELKACEAAQDNLVKSLDKIDVLVGDITTQRVDAIVNAANTTLLGGGGVDGAIHRAAGAELLEECRKIGGCPTGEAKITKGYRLTARYVIHTVGPIWQNGAMGEDDLLRNCYRNSLRLAEQHGIKTIAFPSISTGAYSFPIERAARIAIETIREGLETAKDIDRVVFVCFSRRDYDVYTKALSGK